jgi:hypothetical protein
MMAYSVNYKTTKAGHVVILRVNCKRSRSITGKGINGKTRRRKAGQRQEERCKFHGGPESIASIFLFVDPEPNFSRFKQ